VMFTRTQATYNIFMVSVIYAEKRKTR